MSQIRIATALANLFSDDAHGRIVFWNDADGEFVGVLDDLGLSNVNLLRLDRTNQHSRRKSNWSRATARLRWLVYAPSPCARPGKRLAIGHPLAGQRVSCGLRVDFVG
jgi:hypothetical protein